MCCLRDREWEEDGENWIPAVLNKKTEAFLSVQFYYWSVSSCVALCCHLSCCFAYQSTEYICGAKGTVILVCIFVITRCCRALNMFVGQRELSFWCVYLLLQDAAEHWICLWGKGNCHSGVYICYYKMLQSTGKCVLATQQKICYNSSWSWHIFFCKLLPRKPSRA